MSLQTWLLLWKLKKNVLFPRLFAGTVVKQRITAEWVPLTLLHFLIRNGKWENDPGFAVGREARRDLLLGATPDRPDPVLTHVLRLRQQLLVHPAQRDGVFRFLVDRHVHVLVPRTEEPVVLQPTTSRTEEDSTVAWPGSFSVAAPVAKIRWPRLRAPNCLKLNSGKFEMFSKLMTGKVILLPELFEANYLFEYQNANND